MPTKQTGFFSDLKVILSLLALGVSFLSFIWMLANQWEQNKRWDSLNVAAVEFKEAKFKVYRELTKKEATSINWGYSPLIYNSPDNWEKYQIPYFLQIRNQVDASLIPNANPVFTINEVEEEIKRLQIKSPILIYRSFQLVFFFENQGKTDAIECNFDIYMKPDDQPWHRSFHSNTPVRIPPGKDINTSFEFALPLQSNMYKHIDFNIKLNFKDFHGNIHTRDLVTSWESDRNSWFYGKEPNYKLSP